MKKLRHVVAFGFKKEVSRHDRDIIIDKFKLICEKIQYVSSFEWGENCSSEKLDNGLTHCFILTFSSSSARDKYLSNPDHVDFSKLLIALAETISVIDFWTEKTE